LVIKNCFADNFPATSNHDYFQYFHHLKLAKILKKLAKMRAAELLEKTLSSENLLYLLVVLKQF
jgi:hypothetical protein